MPSLPPLPPDVQEDPRSTCCESTDPRQHDAECPTAPLDQLGGDI